MSMGFDRSRETPLPKLGQPGGKPFRKAPGYWQEQPLPPLIRPAYDMSRLPTSPKKPLHLPTFVVNDKGRCRSHPIFRSYAVLPLSPALGSWASGVSRATRRKLGRTFLQKHGRLIPKHAASKLAFVPMCGSDLIGSPKSGSNINKRVIEVVPVVTYYRRLFRAGRFRRSRVN
jgi:hypothetical protein